VTEGKPFQVIDTSSWRVDDTEAIGEEEKIWLLSPEGTRWLFKPVVRHEGWQQGEDWAERVACEVARLMDVPAAEIELATRGGRPGCLSRSVIPAGWEMQHGAVMLSGLVDGYQSRVKYRTGHNLANIEAALRRCGPPSMAMLSDSFDGFAAFVGFLLFDALIANCDRHDENWSVLRDPLSDEPPALAPSYDHANSLGFNLQDTARTRWLKGRKIAEWAEKGRATRFERTADTPAPTLVALARDAIDRTSDGVRTYWRDRVGSLTEDDFRAILDAVPNLSDPGRTFALQLLQVNIRRVLDGCWQRT